MFLRVEKLLSEEQLAVADKVLAAGTFVAGDVSAGPAAQRVKNNLQLDKEKSEGAKDLDALILGALSNNPLIKAVALPARIAEPLYNKHGPGMSYGPHSDNPVMGVGPALRTDVSISIFLSDPHAYEGSELVVKSEVGDVKFKLPRGDALVYPSGAIHAVMEVKSGERLGAVAWIQSLVADAAKRRLLFELDRACVIVNRKSPETEEARLLLKTYGNLVRMWSRA